MKSVKGQVEMIELASEKSGAPKVVRLWPVDAREAMRVGSHRPVQEHAVNPPQAQTEKQPQVPATPEQVAAAAAAARGAPSTAERMAQASKQADAAGSGAAKP